MSLSPTDSDKKVLRAFANRKPASNNRIESTGDRLNTIGFVGGGCIARWSGDHIIDFGYESGGKFGPALIRALKKYTAPNDWAKKNRGYVTMRKNSQYSYKWFGIISIAGKPKICLANEYKEDAMETRDDLGLPRGLVKIVSRNKIYEMGLKPSPAGPDWARQHEIDALRPPRKNGSRYTARATSGSFWAGQSERFPWRRNPSLTRQELLHLSAAAMQQRDYKTASLCDSAMEGSSSAMQQCAELFETKYRGLVQ
jgi:hypothetical protein